MSNRTQFSGVFRNCLSQGCLPWLLAAVLLCPRAQAALFLEEGFDYSPGVLGTNTPWTRPTNAITVVEGDLGYPNLASVSPPGGTALVVPGGSPNASVTMRPFNSAASGGSVYFSLVVAVTSVGATSPYIAGLLPSSVFLPNGSAFDPCDLYVTNAVGGFRLGVRTKTGILAFAGTVLDFNSRHLVVLKYEFASGRASLYFDPSPGDVEPSSAEASSTGMVVANLDHLFLRDGGSAAGSFKADSLRVGASWEDVTPVGDVPPATRLVFALHPTSGTEQATLTPTVVRLPNETGFNVPSNNVPISLALDHGSFSGGTTTVLTDAHGRATFTDLAIDLPGTYRLVATASGIGSGLVQGVSGEIVIGSTNITARGRALSVFLDSLEVERYWDNGKRVNWLTGAPGGNGTNMTTGDASHCSAFAAAAACVAGVYILRQPDESDMDLANNQANWLATNTDSGWYLIPSPIDAQHIANAGDLVVASLKENGKSGHIAVLRPSTKSDAEILARGPQECQSGIINYNNTDVLTGFGQHNEVLVRILYYGHAVTNAISVVSPVLNTGSFSNGTFQLSTRSIVGRRYKLQCSSQVQGWTNLLSFTNSNEGTEFYCVTPLSDASALGTPQRFYRLSSQ